MDQIFIQGLSIETVIGVYPHERDAPQTLLADIEASIDAARAAAEDDVHLTVDYSAVAKRLVQLGTERSDKLLETFAEAIAGTLLDEFRVAWVQVRLTKPGVVNAARAVGIQIKREAGQK